MSLRSGFLRKSATPDVVSTKGLVVGIAIGAVFAVCIYSLLVVGREALRIFSHTDNFELWVLSGREIWFYDLFTAYISAIFGLSVCLLFLFGRPSSRWGTPRRSFKPVIGDLVNLNSFFLSWITKLALVWGVFFGWTAFDGSYALPFYPDYVHIFVLTVIVLFLNSWTTLLRIYKRRCLKWMGEAFLAVSASAFAMSSIRIVDHGAINDAILSNNLQYAHGVELPVVDTEMDYRIRPIINGFIGMTYEGDGPVKLFFRFNSPGEKYREVSLSELTDMVEREPHLKHYSLLADKRISMTCINRLREALRIAGIDHLDYNFIPAGRRDDSLYSESGLTIFTQRPGPSYDRMMSASGIRKLEIEYISKGSVLFDGRIVFYGELRKEIVNEIKRTCPDGGDLCEKYLLVFHTDNMPYGDYMRIYGSCRAAVDELRNEEALLLFGMDMQLIEDENQMEIVKKYPLAIVESAEYPSL